MHHSVSLRQKNRRFLLSVLLFAAVTAIIGETAVLAADRETVLVIDPGHGGLDGGAVSADGIEESGINLAVSERVYALCQLFGIPACMTRDSETLDYPAEAVTIHDKKLWDQKRRAELVNSYEAAILLSIHQNMYPDPRPSGSQVYYGKCEGSTEFGTLLHDNLIRHLCPGNRRVAAPISDRIYLLKAVRCPAVLAECGFLSNPEEAVKLSDGSYQTALAAVIFASYLQYIS